jgi:DNA-binding transcriptional MocR family regulator
MMPPFAITPTSDARNPALCANARVLTALRGHADKLGRAWPKVETLAVETGLSERTVQRALKRLTVFGLITKNPGTHRYSANVYVIIGHSGVTTLSPQRASRGDNLVASGMTTVVVSGVTQRVTHEQTHLTDSRNKDARASASRLMGALASRRENMTAGEYGLLQSRLQSYERTGF